MSQYDTIVIGGGPGGYVAAIRSAQLGRKTAVVERDKPGGRCLNYACIPAKTMLRTAELYHEAKAGADLGVVARDVSLDWDALGRRRAAVSDSLTAGVAGLWKKNKIDLISGHGTLDGAGNVVVGDTTYQAGAVILATGSTAQTLPDGSWTRGAPGPWPLGRGGWRSSALAPPAASSPRPMRASAPRCS